MTGETNSLRPCARRCRNCESPSASGGTPDARERGLWGGRPGVMPSEGLARTGAGTKNPSAIGPNEAESCRLSQSCRRGYSNQLIVVSIPPRILGLARSSRRRCSSLPSIVASRPASRPRQGSAASSRPGRPRVYVGNRGSHSQAPGRRGHQEHHQGAGLRRRYRAADRAGGRGRRPSRSIVRPCASTASASADANRDCEPNGAGVAERGRSTRQVICPSSRRRWPCPGSGCRRR